ncbi:MAG TPA: hypothetical protein VGH04_10015, partial [Gemmatimonadaceae bacterium]
FPKEGRVVKTKLGEEKVVANDIFRERVTLRGDDGEQRTIPLLDLRAEAEEVGAPLPFSPAPAIVTLDEHEEDIVLEEAVVAERVVILEPLEEGGQVDGWTGEQEEAEESPDPSAASSVQPSTNPTDDHIKRPRRRRGRRGGRRNRPGGGGTGGPSDDSPEGTPSGGA